MFFNPNNSITPLTGKVILVTGGKGIGGATVKLLAEHNPHRIYICARSKASAEELIKTLSHAHPDVEGLFLSLSTWRRWRASSAALLSLPDIMRGWTTCSSTPASPHTAPASTEEGYQSQFGINHLGHTLLAQLLMPTLLRTAKKDAEVRIMVTSVAHIDVWGKGFDSDNVRNANAHGSTLKRNGHSKLANVLFARRLAQRYPEITATSYHPGVVKTEIWNKDEANTWLMVSILY